MKKNIPPLSLFVMLAITSWLVFTAYTRLYQPIMKTRAQTPSGPSDTNVLQEVKEQTLIPLCEAAQNQQKDKYLLYFSSYYKNRLDNLDPNSYRPDPSVPLKEGFIDQDLKYLFPFKYGFKCTDFTDDSTAFGKNIKQTQWAGASEDKYQDNENVYRIYYEPFDKIKLNVYVTKESGHWKIIWKSAKTTVIIDN